VIKKKKIAHPVGNLLNSLGEELEKDESIIFANLFGSSAKGKLSPLSDIDIALFLTDDVDYYAKRLELIEKISKLLLTDEFDLVILNDAPLSISFQIIKTGKLLFSKDDKQRISFVTKTIDHHCDTEYLRRLSLKSLLQRVKRGEFGF